MSNAVADPEAARASRPVSRGVRRTTWRIVAVCVAAAFVAVMIPYVARVHMLMSLSNADGHDVVEGYYVCRAPEFADRSVRRSRLDADGLVVVDYGPKIGRHSAPVPVASYVLAVAPYAADAEVCASVVRNLDALIASADVTPKGNLAFPHRFDWPLAAQKAPWYSGMAQGMAASAFLWGHRLTGDEKYFVAAKRAVLAIDEEQYGVKTQLERGCWLNEFPGYGATVLDGNLAGIAGVYDLQRSLPADDPDGDAVGRLLADCVAGFKANHELFVSDAGHWFDDQETLISSGYHAANLGWLTYLSDYDPELLDIRARYAARHELVACLKDAARFGMRKVARTLGLETMSPRIQ